MSHSPLRVFKFGGASIKDAEAIRNVGKILEAYADSPLLIVVSAMGKTTNALEEVVNAYHANDLPLAAERLVAIRDQHLATVQSLFGNIPAALAAELNDLLVSVEWALEDEPNVSYDYDYDQIVSVGELLSSRIVAAYLQHAGLTTHWLDARDVIITDNIFREGWVQWPTTLDRAQKMVGPLLEQGGFVLTQGFIGSTSENFTTTLGREGSDYTAAIFSYCLDAESMSIWKDVPGVLTADPRYFENVSKLDRLSYKEAIEMTYYGAKVIHPKTIKPLQNKNIPLYVRSFLQPTAAGTVISEALDETYPAMVAVERNQALLHISTRDFSFVAEQHIKYLFEKITEVRLQVNMMQNTAISFNLVFNDTDDKVDRFIQLIDADYKTTIDRDLELITVRHYTKAVMEELRQGKIVLLEERLPRTIQMVAKNAPVLSRKKG
ncbi:MAG: aspartate kinase [Bacteroidota bacterium]